MCDKAAVLRPSGIVRLTYWLSAGAAVRAEIEGMQIGLAEVMDHHDAKQLLFTLHTTLSLAP